MSILSALCQWFKKGWVPVDDFSTGRQKEEYLTTNTLYQLPLVECILPPFIFLRCYPFSCLKHGGMVLERINGRESQRGNQLYICCLTIFRHRLTCLVADSLYTVSQKNETLYSCPQFRQILTDFQNSFTIRFSKKFTIKKSLKIPNTDTISDWLNLSDFWILIFHKVV